MAARMGARIMAPLALIATVVAIYLLVHHELGRKHASPQPTPHTTLSVHSSSTQTSTTPPPVSFYVVKAGDSLSSIAVKTHTSLATLEQLNPSVNPTALQTGQRLRIRK